MNAPEQVTPLNTPAAAVALIAGRCIGVRKVNDIFLHLVTMPAPDAYSHPSTVEVSADTRLAEKDGDFKAKCRIIGFARQYKATDKDTGEVRVVRTADIRLTALS